MSHLRALGSSTDFIIPVTSLTSTGSPGIVYISFTCDTPTEYTLVSFQCTLKFITKQLDPTSGEPEEEGYADEYQLEEVKLGPCGDYIVLNYVTFSSEWDRLRAGSTATETFALSAMESIMVACDSIIEILNMEALGGTDNPQSTSAYSPAVWSCDQRWWKGVGPEPDDILCWTRCYTRTHRPSGKGRSYMACGIR
ncbi:uncharacterized protein ARMOST_11397 [Armillaria ostoyae]|uniref:Coatomer gamma subunit appendage Ig-like subdomain domain-containing protein n=1 Tax=Armillaria ostoyae TaxID=47428 RepID=A0A284RH10_ARMOS|nr:uncharacterized protein ARMOST_11397 [Armillaria ostoyae]